MHKIALSIAGNTCEEAEGGECLAAVSKSDSCAGEEGRKECWTERVLELALPREGSPHLTGVGLPQYPLVRSLGGDGRWDVWPRHQCGGGYRGIAATATSPVHSLAQALSLCSQGAAPAGRWGSLLRPLRSGRVRTKDRG